MVTVEVELLTGRYVAASFNDRGEVEWPPHPARLFSALVAAWGDAETPDGGEPAALAWLEAAPAPRITCSAESDVKLRAPVTHYVAVSDPAAVRDLSRGYQRLVDAVAAVDGLSQQPDPDPVALGKARRGLATAQKKARAESAAATAVGSTRDLSPKALEVLPELRGKQGRMFPTVIPPWPVVVYTWPDHDGDDTHRVALARLVGRVGRLGHSSSLVACRLAETAPEGTAPAPTLVPDEDGAAMLRVPGRGQTAALEEHYARHQGREPRTLPAVMQPYGPPTPERRLYPEPVLDRLWQIFTLEPAEGMPPANLGAGDGVAVARAVRQALARECDTAAEPVPDVVRELMTGRAATTAGGPAAAARSERPHLAVVPLPWVGHRHADGLVKGVALLLPRELSPEVRRAALAVIGRWQASDPDGVRLEFADDNAGTWALGPVGDGVTIATLTAWRWCRPTATWSTATPIALDGYPGDLRSRDPGRAAKAWAKAAGLIARSCSRIGLPAPDDVEISRDPVVAGASPARAFPAFRSSGNDPGRVLVHAVIRFPEPVRGPVLLGAGRYLGLGLCLPTNQERFNG